LPTALSVFLSFLDLHVQLSPAADVDGAAAALRQRRKVQINLWRSTITFLTFIPIIKHNLLHFKRFSIVFFSALSRCSAELRFNQNIKADPQNVRCYLILKITNC